MRRSHALLAAVLAAAPTVAGCETYVAPPKVLIAGESEGLLDNPRAPVELAFSKPIAKDTLRVTIAALDTDLAGDLPDERTPPAPLTTFFAHVPDPSVDDVGGTSALSPDATRFRMSLDKTLPVGRRLVVLVEPGLADEDGHVVRTRQRLPFGYEVKCRDQPIADFATGKYFLMLNVDRPIPVQIRLWTDLDIDPPTGRFVGQFTSGIRNRDPNRCSPPCPTTDACRTLPGPPKCVIPSEKASSVDEYPDYVVNAAPPTGFSFTVPGCVEEDASGTVAFAIAPVDVTVQQPPVSIRALSVTASFQKDAAGVWRATGTASGDDVKLGNFSSGSASGNATARSLPASDWPADAPDVPYGPRTEDGGLR